MICVNQKTLRLAGIKECSFVDGPGLRFTVYTQGCPHKCKGCHNPGTHDPNGGYDYGIDKLAAEVIKNGYDKITFTGGEPFYQAAALATTANIIHRKMHAEILLYSGYLCEDLLEFAETDPGTRALLTCSNFLIDGKYNEDERDLNLPFRGSRNQRIFDITCYPNSKLVRQIEL